MSIQTQIKDEIKEAMKAKDELRLTVLRGLSSAFTNELVSSGKTPQDSISDDDALTVIKRQAKQRKDAISQFEKGGRNDLAEKEKLELLILEAYLPEMMNEEEIEKIVIVKMNELGVKDKSSMGILIGNVMKELNGKADGALVKEVVEKLLA